MRIELDRSRCQGHNRCHLVAPELFETYDEGYAEVLDRGELSSARAARAELAADNCPEFAIRVLDSTEGR